MSAYQDILAQLRELLQPFAKNLPKITEETELVADMGLDSLKIMDLLLRIEDQFDVSVPLNVLPEVQTVRDLALELQKLTEKQ